MRRLFILVMLCALFVGGCRGVYMNAEYNQLLDRTTALSVQTAERAQADELASAEMVTALVVQSEVWKRFMDARDGVDGSSP